MSEYDEACVKDAVKEISNLIAANKLDLALNKTEEYAIKYPTEKIFIYYKGKVLFFAGNKQGAKLEFEKITKDESLIFVHNAYFYLGEIAQFSERPNIDLAINCYKKAIELAPDNEFKSYVSLAKIEINRKNYLETLNILNKCKNKKSIEVLYTKAIALKGLKRYKEAKAVLDSIDLDNANLYFLRNIYIEKAKATEDNKEQAEEYLKKALVGPKNSSYWYALYEFGFFYAKYQQYAQALECYNSIIKNPKVSQKLKDKVVCEIGYIYQYNILYKEAIEEYKKISEQSNLYSKAIYRLAAIYHNIGNYEQAKEYLEKVPFINKKQQMRTLYTYAISLYRNHEYDTVKKLINIIEYNELEDENYFNYKFLKELFSNKTSSNNCEYAVKQLRNYSQARLVYYMLDMNRNIAVEGDIYSDESVRFNPDINLGQLCNKVSSKVIDMEPERRDIFDYYNIPYKNVGFIGEQEANGLRALTLPDTKSVLRFYPCIMPDRNLNKPTARQKVKNNLN